MKKLKRRTANDEVAYVKSENPLNRLNRTSRNFDNSAKTGEDMLTKTQL